MNLLIHFQPGARGDFLANILLDFWKELPNGRMVQPNYKKIHHINHHGNYDCFGNQEYSWNDVRKFKGLKIRIDAGLNAEKLLTIELNHLIKNAKIYNFNLSDYDRAYNAACYFLDKERKEIISNSKLFDHWISFEKLYDIEFIKNFYFEITGRILSPEKIKIISENIDQQPKLDLQFQKLALLLQFEIDNKLITREKYFNMFDELLSIEKFLDLKYYSDKNF